MGNDGLQFNRNDKQVNFNQIKGKITEKNDGEKFCSITIECGHENPRSVNFVCRKNEFDTIPHQLGDKVCVRFYAVSRKKHERWYTTLNLLSIDKEA